MHGQSSVPGCPADHIRFISSLRESTASGGGVDGSMRIEAGASPGKRVLIGLAVMTGLLLGGGGAALHYRTPAPSNFSGAASVTTLDLPASGALAAPTPLLQPASVPPPDSPTSALQQYLDAEIAGNSAVALALVDRATRERVGVVAAWVADRPNRLRPATYRILGTKPVAAGVELAVDARRDPSINPLTGFVPARSKETWLAVEEDGWRIATGRPIDMRPELPSDAAATEAASRWLAASAGCDERAAAAIQLSPTLLGASGIGDELCDISGEVSASPATSLSRATDSTPFVSAFGGSVGDWGRAVSVTGAVRFTIVLAPLGDEWRVMGLVP